MDRYDATGMTVQQVLDLKREGIYEGEKKEMIVAKAHNITGTHFLYVVYDKENE